MPQVPAVQEVAIPPPVLADRTAPPRSFRVQMEDRFGGSANPNVDAPAGTAAQAQLLSLPAYQRLDARDQAKVQALLRTAGPDSLQDIIALLAPSSDPGRSPCPLLSRDFKGGRLLDSLTSLTLPGRVEPALQGHQPELVAGLLKDLAHPGTIRQGYQSCSVRSFSDILAHTQPAEYGRFAAGLASPTGEVPMAGGQTLKRNPGSEAPDYDVVKQVDSTEGRTFSARMIQSALLDHANGWRGYDPRFQVHLDSEGHFLKVNDDYIGGLTFIEELGLAKQVFGREFVVHDMTGATMDLANAPPSVIAAPHTFLERLATGHPFAQETMTSNGTLTPDPVHQGALLAELKARNGQDTPVSIWTPSFSHGAVFEKAEGGRVYLRDAQMAAGLDPPPKDFPIKVENAAEGRVSVPEAAFQNALLGYMVPK